MIMVWPQYINKKLSLSEGRKVSKEFAVSDPTVNDIERAAKRMGLQVTVEKDKSYPGKWYEKSGRVLVESDAKKLELLKDICEEIKRMRK